MRALVTIRQISNISPIDGAEFIERATVDGWHVVVKRGEFNVGDLAVYCEVDSWIPQAVAPFLSHGTPREFEGVVGERLRTVRLRGQISQGLLLPIDVVSADGVTAPARRAINTYGTDPDILRCVDLTSAFGVVQWIAPMPTNLSGEARSAFPANIPKTDQERIQNLSSAVGQFRALGPVFEVTEKLDGSSMTAVMLDGELHVCSRNLNLRHTEGNSFWQMAVRLDIATKLSDPKFNGLALQGELIGPGIQQNKYKLSNHQFRVFDVYDTRLRQYLAPSERRDLVSTLGLDHVPVLDVTGSVDEDLDAMIASADGYSALCPTQLREGVVYKAGMDHFKIISNKWLLKTGE